MSDRELSKITASALVALAKDPPKDHRARQELYEAAKLLMYSVEEWADLVHRIFFGVSRVNTPGGCVLLRVKAEHRAMI
jgi:hypothetical protein